MESLLPHLAIAIGILVFAGWLTYNGIKRAKYRKRVVEQQKIFVKDEVRVLPDDLIGVIIVYVKDLGWRARFHTRKNELHIKHFTNHSLEAIEEHKTVKTWPSGADWFDGMVFEVEEVPTEQLKQLVELLNQFTLKELTELTNKYYYLMTVTGGNLNIRFKDNRPDPCVLDFRDRALPYKVQYLTETVMPHLNKLLDFVKWRSQRINYINETPILAPAHAVGGKYHMLIADEYFAEVIFERQLGLVAVQSAGKDNQVVTGDCIVSLKGKKLLVNSYDISPQEL